MSNFKKKLKFFPFDTWDHHRSGWNFCVKNMIENFENKDGIAFYPNRVWEKLTSKKNESYDWIGFYHVTPLCVNGMIKTFGLDLINKNLKYCKGLYVLSKYTKKHIDKIFKIPVEVIYYATEKNNIKFNFDDFFNNKNKKLFFIGNWLRKYDVFENIKNDIFEKIYLGTSRINEKIKNYTYVNQYEYDLILSNNIVFLDFLDSSCNTAIIECMERNTPVMCPKAEPSIEYLGEDYPFFFESINEVEKKLNDFSIIKKTFEYLKNMNKEKINIDYFIKSIANSEIYKNLKINNKIKYY